LVQDRWIALGLSPLDPGPANLADAVIKGGRAVAARPNISAEDVLVKGGGSIDRFGWDLDVTDFSITQCRMLFHNCIYYRDGFSEY